MIMTKNLHNETGILFIRLSCAFLVYVARLGTFILRKCKLMRLNSLFLLFSLKSTSQDDSRRGSDTASYQKCYQVNKKSQSKANYERTDFN